MIFKFLSILLRYPDDGILEYREELASAAHELPDWPAKDAVLGRATDIPGVGKSLILPL